MNDEIREGLKMVARGTKEGTKKALIAFKTCVDKFVDTVTDDKFEEKMRAETKAMAENFNREIQEIKARLEEMSKEATEEYKKEIDENREKIKKAVDKAADEMKKEADK